MQKKSTKTTQKKKHAQEKTQTSAGEGLAVGSGLEGTRSGSPNANVTGCVFS
jgi:hypothetical protein